MSDDIRVPFRFDGAAQARADINNVDRSLAGLSAQVSALARSDNESREAMSRLQREFVASRQSSEQYRTELGSLTQAEARQSAEARRTADSQRESAAATAFGFNQVVDAARNAYSTFSTFAGSVAQLAAEQERLDVNSERLGLDFNAAADAAGRFVDETEAMAAATRLSEAGLNLTQEQLEALTRVAARFAQNTGTTTSAAIDQLTQGLITGSARGLRPFGGELQAVAGGSHTATQRLAALTTQAAHTEQATDDAASAMERLRDSMEDMERTAASAFAQSVTDTLRLATAADEAGASFDILDSDITRAARTVGTAVVGIGNGIALVVGGLATGIASMLSMTVAAASAAGAVIDRVRARNFSGLADAASAAYSASYADSPITQALARFTEQRAAAAEAIFSQVSSIGGDGALPEDAPAAAARRGVTASSGASHNTRDAKSAKAAQMAADADARALDAARITAGREYLRLLAQQADTEARARREAAEARAEELTHANAIAQARARIVALSHEATAANEVSLARARSGQQRAEWAISQRAELEDARDPAVQADRLEEMRQAHAIERERAHLQQRYELNRSFTDRMEELHGQQFNSSQALATGVTDAFGAMGEAVVAHTSLLLRDKETFADAARSIASETLESVAKQAVVKGGFEFAEGASALAGIVTAPLAPGHFAAGALYLGVAALAGAGAAAVAPSTPSTAGAASHSTPAERPLGLGGSASNDNARGHSNVTINLGGGFVMGSHRDLAEELARLLNDPTAGFALNGSRVRMTGTGGRW